MDNIYVTVWMLVCGISLLAIGYIIGHIVEHKQGFNDASKIVTQFLNEIQNFTNK